MGRARDSVPTVIPSGYVIVSSVVVIDVEIRFARWRQQERGVEQTLLPSCGTPVIGSLVIVCRPCVLSPGKRGSDTDVL